MKRLSCVLVITDEEDLKLQAKRWSDSMGVALHSFSPSQWEKGLEDKDFRDNLVRELHLTSAETDQEFEACEEQENQALEGKVLPFPKAQEGPHTISLANMGLHPDEIVPIQELEAKAITDAISKYSFNITEAAKALGIGRATLYRKIRIYKINLRHMRARKFLAQNAS
jgi:DNA-binding NtrC family response regulator